MLYIALKKVSSVDCKEGAHLFYQKLQNYVGAPAHCGVIQLSDAHRKYLKTFTITYINEKKICLAVGWRRCDDIYKTRIKAIQNKGAT